MKSSKYGIRARQKFNQSSQTNFESRSLEQELGGGDVKYSLKKKLLNIIFAKEVCW